MDVVVWLRGLGLGKYEAAFRENEIDEAVLPNLTAEDLKDLGVGIVGHRRKLLEAIAALRADTTRRAPSADAASPSAAPSVPAEDRAERRQVTVMFSDLVGSTALSGRMDPEDLRELISAYQKCVAETVQRFGGFVAKYMGDGVLVYFGYPQAHEDDAERAVRAGLQLVPAVGDLKTTRAPLQTRVGIATGLVVVGDLVGSGDAQERGIVGETPNVAARLQAIAEPNMVVIADSTRRLLGNLFELEDLGARDIKGTAGPVRAWTALRPSGVESRFEALHASGLTELVGREELELLLRRWTRAKSSEGQVVLLSGEAGIGKSRLTAALMERLEGEPHTRLRYFCSPQHTDSALYPFIGQMERAAGLAHGDTAQVKLDKLGALLAQTSTSIQDMSLFADMLSLSSDARGLLQLRLQRKAGRYPALDMTSEQRRQKTFDALGSQMEALSRSNPVLMIFEDAHWADPTSLEVVSRIVDRLRNLRVLFIATFRPEFDPPWIGRSYVTALTLNRLAQRDIEAMIERVVGNKSIPASVRHDIIKRTDGIPLFVEEMTKSVLEAGGDEEAQWTAATVPSTALAVPASLHASLMARLDRLGSAKEVAQVGAAIGREISHALLIAVLRKPEAELTSALDRLTAAGLLFRQGAPPNATYLFKHALVQDAAYGTLLREPRRKLHARIAETLESQFTEIAETQPELLARHYSEAGLIEKAVGLWGKAGARFLDHSALVEAIEAFRRALDQIATLPSTPAQRRREINLQVALLAPLAHVKGYTPETKAAAERARLIIEQAEARGEPLEDPMQLFRVLNTFWNASFAAFNGDAMRELATQVLALAKKQGAALPLVTGHHQMGTSLVLTGEIVEGRTHLDQSVALYDPAENPLVATYLGAHQTAGLSVRSLTLWLLGYPQAALADADQSLADTRELDRATPLIEALAWGCLLHTLCGKYLIADALVASAFAASGSWDLSETSPAMRSTSASHQLSLVVSIASTMPLSLQGTQ
jgi:class 3 adenylate cyclase